MSLTWAAHLARVGRGETAPIAAGAHCGAGAGASTDDLQQTLKTWAADLRTIRQAVNQGFPPYDVFISHDGRLKHTLVSVLRKLFPPHVRTFTDIWELRHGDNSPAAMVKACGTAKVGVVVLSPESVAKEWPMHELHILVHRHRRGEVALVPLLWFDTFDAFVSVVHGYLQCTGRRRLWASLLQYVSKMCMVVKGELTAHRSLPEVAGEAVEASLRLLQEQRPPALACQQEQAAVVASHRRAVGFDDQLASLMEMMAGGWGVWLNGQGGVGKTRMATQLQHDLQAAGLVSRVAVLSLEFTAGSGPTLSREAALRLLAGAVLALEGMDCSTAPEGQIRKLFAEAATRPHTLLVVDNVHSQEQLGLLLGEPLRLEGVPFLVFTSRLQQPIAGSDFANVWTQVQCRLHHHAVHTLSPGAALQLFRDSCKRPQSVSEAVEAHVVRVCGGLPLALLILAGTLVGQEEEAAWMAAAQAMEEGGDPADAVLAESEFKLQHMVRHSLLGLRPEAVGMFLDTACLLVGRQEADALAVWRQWHGSRRAEAALRQLKNRHLVAVRQRKTRDWLWGTATVGVLWMHDVLRWYGRRVVRGEAELEGLRHKGSRLWVHNGRVEPQATRGKRFQVLAAQLDVSNEGVADEGVGEVVLQKKPPPELGNVLDHGACDFQESRILLAERQQVDDVGSMASALWLEVPATDGASLDRTFRGSRSLIILTICDPDTADLPRAPVAGMRAVQQRCQLKRLPESLGRLVQLQQLHLAGCSSLVALPESIGQLTALQQLDLSGCKSIARLPDTIGQLSFLERLILENCTSLVGLPETVGRLSSLQWLYLGACERLESLPESLGQLGSLQRLSLFDCISLLDLPESLGQLSSLQLLSLAGCEELACLPASVGQLTSLLRLNLFTCIGLTTLPESVGNLSLLRQLDLQRCASLVSLPESLGQLTALRQLNLSHCISLACLPESLGCLFLLQRLNLGGCRRLASLPESLGGLLSLQQLSLSDCSSLVSLPASVAMLSSLQRLDLERCSSTLSTVSGSSLGSVSSPPEQPGSADCGSSLVGSDNISLVNSSSIELVNSLVSSSGSSLVSSSGSSLVSSSGSSLTSGGSQIGSAMLASGGNSSLPSSHRLVPGSCLITGTALVSTNRLVGSSLLGTSSTLASRGRWASSSGVSSGTASADSSLLGNSINLPSTSSLPGTSTSSGLLSGSDALVGSSGSSTPSINSNLLSSSSASSSSMVLKWQPGSAA